MRNEREIRKALRSMPMPGLRLLYASLLDLSIEMMDRLNRREVEERLVRHLALLQSYEGIVVIAGKVQRELSHAISLPLAAMLGAEPPREPATEEEI